MQDLERIARRGPSFTDMVLPHAERGPEEDGQWAHAYNYVPNSVLGDWGFEVEPQWTGLNQVCVCVCARVRVPAPLMSHVQEAPHANAVHTLGKASSSGPHLCFSHGIDMAIFPHEEHVGNLSDSTELC